MPKVQWECNDFNQTVDVYTRIEATQKEINELSQIIKSLAPIEKTNNKAATMLWRLRNNLRESKGILLNYEEELKTKKG